jgi:hypothetical protein
MLSNTTLWRYRTGIAISLMTIPEPISSSRIQSLLPEPYLQMMAHINITITFLPKIFLHRIFLSVFPLNFSVPCFPIRSTPLHFFNIMVPTNFEYIFHYNMAIFWCLLLDLFNDVLSAAGPCAMKDFKTPKLWIAKRTEETTRGLFEALSQ